MLSSKSILIACSTLTCLGGGLCTTESRADGGATAATVIAAAEIGVKVIGGLASWVDDQTDDCSAAAAAGVKGCECGFEREECKDTGYLLASTDVCDGSHPEVDNACGTAWGAAVAAESPAGAWAGRSTVAYAIAWAKSTECGENVAYAWATAKVDGTAKTVENGGVSRPEAVEDRRDLLAFDDPRGLEPPAPRSAQDGGRPSGSWADGTILAFIDLSDLRLTVPKDAQKDALARGTLVVSGVELLSYEVTLSSTGTLASTGIDPTDWDLAYDAANETWTAVYAGPDLEFPIGRQGSAARYFEVSFTSDATNDPSSLDQGFVEYVPENHCCRSNEVEPIPHEYGNAVQPPVPMVDEFNLAPNPFRSATDIGFSMAERAFVALDVYDVAGRHVTQLMRGELGAGIHAVRWDGTNDAGEDAGSGVYYAILKVGKRELLRRVVLSR